MAKVMVTRDLKYVDPKTALNDYVTFEMKEQQAKEKHTHLKKKFKTILDMVL